MVRFEDAKKRIDEYFDSVTPGKLIKRALKYGLRFSNYETGDDTCMWEVLTYCDGYWYKAWCKGDDGEGEAGWKKTGDICPYCGNPIQMFCDGSDDAICPMCNNTGVYDGETACPYCGRTEDGAKITEKG